MKMMPNKWMHRMTDPPCGLVAGAVGSLRAPTLIAGFRSVIGDPCRWAKLRYADEP